MRSLITLTALVCALWPRPASADGLRIVADTAVTQSLVDMVLGATGEAEVLLPPGASPHDFALRPSDAAALAAADLVVWTGPALTPWLEETLDALAGDTARVTLLDSPGFTPRTLRSDPAFGSGDAEAGVDPHAWLDPRAASAWIGAIETALSAADPDHAADYAANAAAARDHLGALEQEIAAILAPVAGMPILVPHDALGYFEDRFGLNVTAALAGADGAAPGPARLRELERRLAEGAVGCLLIDPETDPGWIRILDPAEELARGEIDPEGVTLEAGPEFYDRLLRLNAEGIRTCAPA